MNDDNRCGYCMNMHLILVVSSLGEGGKFMFEGQVSLVWMCNPLVVHAVALYECCKYDSHVKCRSGAQNGKANGMSHPC